MFYLNLVDYTMYFPVLTLRSTWGFYLNHLLPLRPFKSVLDNVLLEHGGLPYVLPFAVHMNRCFRVILLPVILSLFGPSENTEWENNSTENV